MSSQAGMDFGNEHQEKYSKVLDSWTDKVDSPSDITKKLENKWGSDLLDTLAEPLLEALSSKSSLNSWTKAGLDLPSKEVLGLFSKISAKYALSYASPDLLRRLAISVKNDKENPPEKVITASLDKNKSLTASLDKSKSLTAAAKVVRPSELSARSPQTVAQIYDMAKDKFNSILNRYLQRDGQLTGKRRWVTEDSNSRHSSLNNEIRDESEPFTYKNKNIDGPRPVGGNPADWSNCSCRIQVQRKNGKWLDVSD